MSGSVPQAPPAGPSGAFRPGSARAFALFVAVALFVPPLFGILAQVAGWKPAWAEGLQHTTLILLVLGFVRRTRFPLLAVRGVAPLDWGLVLLAALAAVLYQWQTGSLFLPAYLDASDWQDPEVWGHIVAAGLLAPLAEEWLFRGLIQRRLTESIGAMGAWGFSAGLFALAHLDFRPERLLVLVVYGLVYGGLFHRSRAWLPPFVAHGANNLAAILFGS